MADAADRVIPFGVLPSRENYSIKPFKNGLRTPKNLGIPAAEKDIHALRDRQLLPRIERFCKASQRLLRDIYNNPLLPKKIPEYYIRQVCDAPAWEVRIEDRGAIREMLQYMSSHSHHTTETCLPRVRKYVEYYAKFRMLLEVSDHHSQLAPALSIQQRAGEILIYLDVWDGHAGILPVLRGFNLLVRNVVLSDDVSFSVEYPPPKYALPLGQLCQIEKQTQEPVELDEVVVMGITSPAKALWRFRFSKEADRCCYSLKMLVADISQLKSPNTKRADGQQGGRGNRVHEQSDAASAFQAVNEFAGRYPNSRIDTAPGKLIFTRSLEEDFVKAIREGWASVLSEKTSKRKIKDDEPHGSKRKRRG